MTCAWVCLRGWVYRCRGKAVSGRRFGDDVAESGEQLTLRLGTRTGLLQLVQLLLHVVEVMLQHLVRFLVRPLLPPALGQVSLKPRYRLGLLLDTFEALLQQLDLDERLLVRLVLQGRRLRVRPR